MAPAYRVQDKKLHRAAGDTEKHYERKSQVDPTLQKDFVRTKLDAARAILTELASRPNANRIKTGSAEDLVPKKPCYQLCRSTLHQLPATVKRPAYNPATVTPGILHIGTGNFALAHMASYVNDMLEHDQRWGIVATSIRSNKTISALRKQDGMYVLVVRENQNRSSSVLAPVVDTMFGPKDPRALISRMGEENIKMVTVTVTNKGYYLAEGGKLDVLHPDIIHDLAQPDRPKSIYGYLAAGLRLRAQTIKTPMTIMSLDNIEQNSSTMKKVFVEFLKLVDPELVSWVDDNVDFPVTLVDRITPEPTEAFRKDAHKEMGFDSTLTIGCESFRQLVVERGRFPETTPGWEKVGVQVVDSCAEYWQRKFYCLNAGHLIVATCGHRLGCKYIHDTMHKPTIARLLTKAQNEWCTFLSGKPAELKKYTECIRNRFSDASLNDTVRRVGARATSKISDRLLSSVERAMAATGNKTDVIRVPAFTMAVWLLNLSRTNESGVQFEADDAEYHKVHPIYTTAMGHLVACPKEATHLPMDATRGLLRSLASTLNEQRFNRLADVDAFVRTFSWSLFAIHRMGLEAAIETLLEATPALPASVKRVASTEAKREMWKKVHIGGKVKIVRELTV
ncbi:uncharacterized protein SPPG_07177 [Spizellomyces punctatus DAOM BR117]|uniref:mannitol 2-dehydrogenase n=1 Tax=Spizellomyces punctatus (strain DAOM BR117) TaxID=645134 RepID=A0A0L0H865_SPIPD|nr:uncharacterized protein SPPG_07177 [Spizellomyces punctatus DAOM BR117]KNC97715.1 hypothetical protein SPPG_07177 [Spizellomyces punctatus DAOM BR117]|eukprot:XP_016605755.1 hypothetical protein SPPG_07177 [Spizellomyces punctatus DAOM BR117]